LKDQIIENLEFQINIELKKQILEQIKIIIAIMEMAMLIKIVMIKIMKAMMKIKEKEKK